MPRVPCGLQPPRIQSCISPLAPLHAALHIFLSLTSTPTHTHTHHCHPDPDPLHLLIVTTPPPAPPPLGCTPVPVPAPPLPDALCGTTSTQCPSKGGAGSPSQHGAPQQVVFAAPGRWVKHGDPMDNNKSTPAMVVDAPPRQCTVCPKSTNTNIKPP